MNLIFGKRVTSAVNKELLREIYTHIGEVQVQEPLPPELVLDACGQVAAQLKGSKMLRYLQMQGLAQSEISSALVVAETVLDRDELQKRRQRELGQASEWMPLGTLFHISAGNAYGLPAFSVLEGLLTGNINLLKLPGMGDEISLMLLEALIEAEPRLADYICVFDIASYEQKLLKAIAKMADAVVVWGGDQAVQAVRRLADPNVRLIEWGHKISFAYVQSDGVTTEQLKEIAVHMCKTRQLYCNSCQGIYLDTDDFDKVKAFAEQYAQLLAEAEEMVSLAPLPQGLQAQLTLQLRRLEIEAIQKASGKSLYRCGKISVRAEQQPQLEPSLLFGNCWVKPLPKVNIIRTLKPAKSYLQTAALYCQEHRREEYARLLLRAGIGRVTTAAKLERPEQGLPHDGEYAFRKYCRMVTYD